MQCIISIINIQILQLTHVLGKQFKMWHLISHVVTHVSNERREKCQAFVVANERNVHFSSEISICFVVSNSITYTINDFISILFR